MVGIYKFTSKITGLSYIGQSIALSKRYNEHIKNMDNPEKNKSKWYQALREQGIENFEYSIIEECKPAELNERETYWIAFYNSYHNGYNSTPGGQEKIYDPQPIYDAWDAGLAPSEIAKKLNIGISCVRYNLNEYKNYSKHEASIRGGKLARETALKNGKIDNINEYIYQYDSKGNFIKEWNSCKEVQRTLGYNAALIGKVISGKRKSAYNYQWTNYYQEKIKPYTNTIGKSREVIQYDLNMNEIARYSSLKEAGRQTSTDSSLISRVCKNGNKASGFYWRYAEN